MELLIWLWVFDNKLLCGLHSSGYFSFVYIWLIPVVSATTALLFSQIGKYIDKRDMALCFADAWIAENGRIL